MRQVLSLCEVRSWSESDVASLALHANNPAIWRNLRDGAPEPYTADHAKGYITRVSEARPETAFAIVVDGGAVGSIGFTLGHNVERVSAELGYWLAEPYWGRGIATESVRAVTALAISEHGLTRVFALPFAWNTASCRVLEKAGFTLEARLRKSAIKEGRLTDQFLYAFVAPD
jgi:[ribosomal protein S5]-alanine N-acetyltransferase